MFPALLDVCSRTLGVTALFLCVTLLSFSDGHAVVQDLGGAPPTHPPSTPGATQDVVRFDSPQVDGIPMDGCLVWADRCEHTAAESFCQSAAFAAVHDYRIAGGTSTKTLLSKEVCDASNWLCGHFEYIECHGSLVTADDIALDASTLFLNTHLPAHTFDAHPTNYYRITLPTSTGIAILSTGSLDLKATLYSMQGGHLVDIDTDSDGIPDDNERRESNQYKDVTGTVHTNFMLRPGAWDDAQKRRIVPAGTYYLAVELENLPQTTSDLTFGLTLLERASTAGQFFTGLTTLVSDDDNHDDYLDIYVKALYPEVFDKKSNNWGNTYSWNGVVRERQCKALPNFFVRYVLNRPYYLSVDETIAANFARIDNQYVIQGPGSLIYNGGASPTFGEIADAIMGDVFVKKLTGFNHYGLYISNQRQVIDANWNSDGMLHIANDADRGLNQWKVVRP